MKTAIVTGSGGLIGSEAVRYFAREGFHVIGIDNDMRSVFFGEAASTALVVERMKAELGEAYSPQWADIRSRTKMDAIFGAFQPDLVIHAAAQPSHDWAAKEPHVDFGINAVGTLNLLEATRRYAAGATFIHCSTSKVYGNTPNFLPLVPDASRLDLPPEHQYYNGIDTTMSVDQSLHSLFGVSKLSGDLLVQEYGRYFGINTVCFRPGCLTGPAHAGAELHGFLSYLMRCVITGQHYTVHGYGGLQVRCNIHSLDLVRAFDAFYRSPTRPGIVYNIGGGRANACSMREAIALCELVAGKQLHYTVSESARVGDHKWWISDNEPFRRHYPYWDLTMSLEQTVEEIYNHNVERWAA